MLVPPQNELSDDVLGIVDTGAQVSTIPGALVTVESWINSRRPSAEGTAIKYGNNDVQEVYSQVTIGEVTFQVTPNRCSSVLISASQITALGHSISFTEESMCIDDLTLQYGMRFSRPANSRDWKMPLSAIEKLAALRIAHPLGAAPGSSRVRHV